MLNAQALLEHDFGETRHEWGARDSILYALGVGLGRDPLDADDLRFLDERNLCVLPTFSVTLGSPGMWLRAPQFGVNFSRLVHLAQDAQFLASLPPTGTIVGTARVASLTDRGPGNGAMLALEREIADAADATVYCRLRQTLLLRGDGGFGGPQAEREEGYAFTGAPDASAVFDTSPRAALVYRLSGDWNPLHLDPAIARQAGFERPILHGLATYAVAGIATSRAAGRDAAAITRLACRFSGVVLPGDKLRFDLWQNDDAAHFRAFVDDRKVLDNGIAQWSAT